MKESEDAESAITMVRSEKSSYLDEFRYYHIFYIFTFYSLVPSVLKLSCQLFLEFLFIVL